MLLPMAEGSNSNQDENSEDSSETGIKSPPAPPPSKSKPPSPPSSSDSSSDSNPESSPPRPLSESSRSSPPPSPPPPPPPPPSESNNNGDGESPPSPPPPDYSSSGSPPPTLLNSEQSPPPPPSDGGSNGGKDRGSPPSSTPALPENGGTPTDVVPSAWPPRANIGNGEGPPAVAPSRSSSTSDSGSSSAQVTIIVGVVVGGLILVLFAVVMLCLRKKKKKKKVLLAPPGYYGPTVPQGNQVWQANFQGHTMDIPPVSGSGLGHSGDYSSQHSGPHVSSNVGVTPGSYGLGFNSKSAFSYEDLAMATNGFSESNILGQGGFGFVHKGVLPDGKVVAVKSLKSGSGQGEREFQAEVEIISRVHHRHLVSLVGYCIGRGQRMLVYEFLPNSTLEYHLHQIDDPVLDFPTRLRIALGSAKGLAYLHEDCHPRIIHRDIKASNILLDENFEAMVADFGLAKLTSDVNTHVSTRVMGTFGYLAPEYAASGKLTEKSDVFSFGVMLLELLTGRRPVDPKMQYMEDSLVDWARPLLSKALETNSYVELVDSRLEGSYNSQDIQRMVACAAASIGHSARKRPKMSQIVRVLEGDVSLEDLNEGIKPGHSTIYNSSDGSAEYDSRTYSADLKRFRQIAFATQEFTSSEYGGSTSSESGLDPASHTSNDDSRELKSHDFTIGVPHL